MAESGDIAKSHGQIQVHFTTNVPEIELPEEKRQLLVPTSEFTLQYSVMLSRIWLTQLACRYCPICTVANTQFVGDARYAVSCAIRLSD